MTKIKCDSQSHIGAFAVDPQIILAGLGSRKLKHACWIAGVVQPQNKPIALNRVYWSASNGRSIRFALLFHNLPVVHCAFNPALLCIDY